MDMSEWFVPLVDESGRLSFPMPMIEDHFGRTIDWSASKEHCVLHVELPYWLATPDGTVTVELFGWKQKIDIRNTAFAVYSGNRVRRDESNILQLTQSDGHPFSSEQIEQVNGQERFCLRKYRTLLSLPCEIHKGIAVAQNSSDGPVRRDSTIYLRTLSFSLLPYINRLISAYRRVSLDPFSSQLSFWDIPVWHISNESNQLFTYDMSNYFIFESLPESAIHPAHGVPAQAYLRTTIGKVRHSLLVEPVVSLEELLDAWTDYHRGRLGDAIRKAVTSIEIAVSQLLEAALISSGLDQDSSAQKVRGLRFRQQLDDYCSISRRRIPGPIYDWMSLEINGVRLEDELFQAREIRHKIVHESLRPTMRNEGAVLRILETISWLHGWLYNDLRLDPTRSPLYQQQHNRKTLCTFEFEIDSHGIHVEDKKFQRRTDTEPEIASDHRIDEVYQGFLYAQAEKQPPDVEYCTLYAFNRLGYRINEAALTTLGGNLYPRFVAIAKDMVLVYLLDTPGQIETSHVYEVLAKTAVWSSERQQRAGSLIVVNADNETALRKKVDIRFAANDADVAARALGVSLISFLDLVTLAALATHFDNESFNATNYLSQRGAIKGLPEEYNYLGLVRTVFRKIGVVSINLHSSDLCVGDKLIFRDGVRVFRATIETLQVGKAGYSCVFGPCCAGAKLDIDVKKIAECREVYRIRRPKLLGSTLN